MQFKSKDYLTHPTAVQHERGPRKPKSRDGSVGGLSGLSVLPGSDAPHPHHPHHSHFPNTVGESTKLPPMLFPHPSLASLKPPAPPIFTDSIVAPTPIFLPPIASSQSNVLLNLASSHDKVSRKNIFKV